MGVALAEDVRLVQTVVFPAGKAGCEPRRQINRPAQRHHRRREEFAVAPLSAEQELLDRVDLVRLRELQRVEAVVAHVFFDAIRSQKGFDPLATRYLFLTTHYRSELNFTLDNLKSADTSLKNLCTFPLCSDEMV